MSRGLYRDVLSYIGQELKFQNISPVPEKLTIALELSGLQQDMWDLFGCRRKQSLVRPEQHRHCQEPATASVLREGLLQLYQEVCKKRWI